MTDSPARPIHVCFVSPKAYPLFNPETDGIFGGAEVDLYLLSTELAKDENFKVSCVVADYGQSECESHEGVSVIKSLDLGKNALSGAIRIWQALRRIDADIYILKTASPGVPLAMLFCRLHKKVFAYRTASSRECDGTYLKEHCFGGKVFAASLKKAGIIFTQNIADKESLKKTIGVDPVVIANGHRLPELTSEKRDNILWVGRTSEYKRAELFLDLARQVPDEKFVMICQQATGDSSYGDLQKRADEIKNLKFVSRVKFGDIDEYFQRAKIFVNTSDSEGFPNTFIQAGKWATAILSLNVDPDGFIEKNNCGISCSGQWKVFVESLKDMLASDSYIQMGQNARRYVEENHDIVKITVLYKEKFVQLINKGSSKRKAD